MSKRVRRAPPASTGPAASKTASVDDRLARLLDTPLLARIVPHLPPETLHQLIRYRGLDDSGELVASATPEQLTAVFDLDLWPNAQAGHDEQFDEQRFGEWLELFVQGGDAAGAQTVANIDEHLVIVGLSRYVRVFDPGTFEPTAASDDEPIERPSGDGLECEVGGYRIRATRGDTWDAIVSLLVALDAEHPDYFHAVMRGCRRLSNSTPEIDGLDDLLQAPEQQMHELALERERRRSQQGYSTPADARAFLQMARQPRRQRSADTPPVNPLAAAYFRAADEAVASADANARSPRHALEPSTSGDAPESIDAVVDLLIEAGLVPERPRALLEGTDPESTRLAAIRGFMKSLGETDPLAFVARSRELAFLANTLIAGCSVQSRAFTPQEASDAAVAICNLGLEHWPARWPETDTRDFITAFEVGWEVLHEDVSLFVTDQLIVILAELQCVDPEIQRGLRALRRELIKQRKAGTPWRAGEAVEVLSNLDLPAWASVLGLLNECPVVHGAMTAILERRAGAINPTAFEFISTTAQIQAVRAFMARLLDVLSR